MGSRKHSKALAACLGITTCTSCFPFEPTEVSAFYFVTPYNQVREQTLVGTAWVACNKHTKTSNFRRCPAFPLEKETSAPPTSRHDDASVHAASSQTSRKTDPRETEAPDLLEHHISSLRFLGNLDPTVSHFVQSQPTSGKYPPMSFGKEILSDRKSEIDLRSLMVNRESSFIIHLQKSETLCPEEPDRRRSRISSRAANEDEKFPRDFYGDNAPGRKDNAPGNTGREGHDYPLLFLPTGCRGVTPDGIYEAARKATDEI
ncbi:hypothetical protein G5I_10316 [Acromyrmex echinatior]|uniref:Uncharacterized protein n=1 Tax=Acromyrmex echinatior TaxID=103372 RepID=F4WWK2_ACREC|nr:hypothetical protein G5I_10316 [Acromyrmex echinatior]